MRHKRRIIPANVLANQNLRRQYVDEPEPIELILVSSKNAGDINGRVKVRGPVTGLHYELSDVFYIDTRDFDELSDIVEIKRRRGRPKKINANPNNPSAIIRTGQTGTDSGRRGSKREDSPGESDGERDVDARELSTGLSE